MARTPSFKSLAKHSGIWRLDGIGTLSPPTKTQVRFKALFTRIKDNCLDAPYKNTSIHPDKDNQIVKEFPAGSLSKLIIGSLWRDGERISKPIGPPIAFNIDTRNLRYQRIEDGYRIRHDQFVSLIQSSYYNFLDHEQEINKTWVAIIPATKGEKKTQLIVPASELYRFYLGGSSLLCSKSLLGDFSKICKGITPPDRHNHTILSPTYPLHRIENFILFRACSEKSAYDALFHPSRHLAKSISDNQSILEPEQKTPLCINARFPFLGLTTLTVRGKSILISGSKKEKTRVWGFLVMDILHCTHPVNLKDPTLLLEAVGPNRNRGGNNTGKGSGGNDHSNENDNEVDEINNGPSNKRLSRATILNYSNPFSAMQDLSFNYMYKEANRPTKRKAKFVESSNADHSYDDGLYNELFKPTRGLDDVLIDQEIDARNIKDFVDMLGFLRSNLESQGCRITTRTLDDEILVGRELLTKIPQLPKLYKKVRWHKLDESKGNRAVCIVEIKTPKNEYLYLLEVELKETESGFSTALICHENNKILENHFFRDFLASTSAYNGWPSLRKKVSEKYRPNAVDVLNNIILDRVRHKHRKVESSPEITTEKYLKNWADDIDHAIANRSTFKLNV